MTGTSVATEEPDTAWFPSLNRIDVADRCDQARHWPLPGAGATAERFRNLAAEASRDLVVGRLVEAHADASAILAELGGPQVEAGQVWGVWAAGPAASVTAGAPATAAPVARRGASW